MPHNASTRPIALTIAGSDSGGGAGIQADLKTFHRLGVFGTSVVTAVTAQNTLGVRSIHAIPLDSVRDQIDAVADDLRPGAIKTGMLATAALVHTVVDALQYHDLGPLVVDPVMVSTSGARLLDESGEGAVRTHLVPRAALVTPNLHEAGILLGHPVTDVDQMARAARDLVDMGAGAALVKGGHLEGDVVDVLWDGERERRWVRPRIETRHTHGTGCTLSAAITAGFARHDDLVPAVQRAIRFVAAAIASAPGLGAGHGPLNHFVSVD